MPKNTPKDTHKTRKPHFPQLKTKNPFSIDFFWKSLIVPIKGLSAQKTTRSQAEISYESGRVPSDRIKVPAKRSEPKKLKQSMLKH